MPKVAENVFVRFWNNFREYVVYPFSDIRFNDVVDILLLTFLFYVLYVFIKNRRAGKLISGLLVIIGLLIISSVFKMYAVSFVLQNFYQVGILAIIIVFQPEIRSALEKVGNRPLSGLKNLAVTDVRDMTAFNAGLEAVCSATLDMSMMRTGALIVFERSVKLGEYIRPTNEIKAKITPALLRTIFFDKSPLHDGAVVIRNMQIYAAGCVLPLSSNESIDQSLGTRHRAGIGITEVSDAVTVIVSEETGIVSVACEGRIARGYTYNTLKQDLFELLIHNASNPGKARRNGSAEKEAEGGQA